MYVKMVAYWIEEYPTILSYTMKNKFIETCRAIKRCIFRVLRYRKIPKITKVNANYLLNENEMNQEIVQSKEELGEEEEDNDGNIIFYIDDEEVAQFVLINYNFDCDVVKNYDEESWTVYTNITK